MMDEREVPIVKKLIFLNSLFSKNKRLMKISLIGEKWVKKLGVCAPSNLKRDGEFYWQCLTYRWYIKSTKSIYEFDHVTEWPYSKNKKVKARDVLVQFTLENEVCKVCFGNITKTVHENAIKMPNA